MFMNIGAVATIASIGTKNLTLDRRTQSIAVIGFVGEHSLTFLAVEKSRSLRDVDDLTGCHDEAQGTSERIDQQMNLDGQSTSAPAPDPWPPFPLAAC
ncbi:hypothetical protein QN219_32355 [Sinorhizobium sp. 7-81]|nr:hypothetical protein [Sinorhizobium sp. 8-89]MDK1494613.1 hypothetical protein [Sinorhizobium sp. 8-89]